jgi:hypothetical protein
MEGHPNLLPLPQISAVVQPSSIDGCVDNTAEEMLEYLLRLYQADVLDPRHQHLQG